MVTKVTDLNSQWLKRVRMYTNIIEIENSCDNDMDSIVSAEFAVAGRFVVENREYLIANSKDLEKLFKRLDENEEFSDEVSYDIGAYCLNRPFLTRFKDKEEKVA